MKLVQAVFNLFYPPYCVICGELLPTSEWENAVCAVCGQDIPFTKGRKCACCGRELAYGTHCGFCLEREPVFSRADAVFRYDLMRESIARFKYHGAREDGKALGRLMAQYLQMYHADWIAETDYLAAVPLHTDKLRARGFNQADILCKSIAARTGLPYRAGLLTRTQKTAPQSSLSVAERWENVRDVFRAEPCQGAHILLVDDILTTGSTLNACSRALLRAGAAEVTAFCLSVAE